jgi:hypothetical protein
MRRNVPMLIRSGLWAVLACAAATAWAAAAAAEPAGTDEVANISALWKQMRAAEADSAEFKAAQWKLSALLGTMPATRRAAVATAMMDRDAETFVNTAAIELLGPDPIPVPDIQRILCDPQRSFEQRELLKTYYSLCRAEVRASVLTEPTRRQLVDALGERLDNLAGTNVGYGEQRLLVHLCSAVLTRYARSDPNTVPQAAGLLKALAKYAEKADPADTLGMAIPTWQEFVRSKDASADTPAKALKGLGHWDPVVRLKAAALLGEAVPTDDKTAQAVLALLSDGRDEVRAAAARVFAFAKDYQPRRIVPAMVTALTEDRAVFAKPTPAEVLCTRADQAKDQLAPLLEAMNSSARRLGEKRTSDMLLVVSKLLKFATPPQKEGILKLAMLRLSTSPAGALAILEAMGPDAAKAVPSIREYRASADRFMRAYIDRHVLPSILPHELPK